MADASILTNIGDRVRVKEKAREFGLGILQEIPKILQHISNSSHKQDVRDWESNLLNLKRTSLSREILVGVQGETGLGKSSLLNELLRSEIVPTSQVEACTAAVCIYGYNHESGENKRYSAKITSKSWATVEAELTGLKEELAESDNQREAHDDDDADQSESCSYYSKRNIDMVCAWSGLEEEDIRSLSPIEIMQKGNFNKIRNRGLRLLTNDKTCSRTISAPNANKFKKMLRPYAESMDLNSHRTQYWPLVEQVEIYLKAPILRHGLKLVDLPGTQDALSFRAEIAETFQDRLAKQIVVSPASRAGDNKAAADLIFTENDLMKFHLDNKFKADTLCVAITKIDDIQTANAAEEFPTIEIIELQRRLRGAPPEESEDDEFNSEAEDYTRVSLKKKGGTNKRRHASDVSGDNKRQRVDSYEDDESMTTRLVEAQLEEEQAIEEGESRLKYLCIQERNCKMVQNVVESLLKAAKSHASSQAIASSLPAVIPLSSHAYNKMKFGKDATGFPTLESTGIPALGKWLTDTSLPIREAWVDSDLHHIQVLFDAVHGWTKDEFDTLPVLTTDEKKKIRQAVREVGDDLKEIIKKVRIKIQRQLITMKPLRRKNLVKTYVKIHENGENQLERCFDNLKHAIKAWESKNPKGHASSAGKHEKVHWGTYKASIRRHGGLYRTVPKKGAVRRTFNWMADVHTSFWRGHHEKWQTAFSRNFPTLKDKVRGTIHLAFDQWITVLLDNEDLPVSFRDMVKKNSYKMENVFLLFTDKIVASMDKLRGKALRMSKVDVLSTLTKQMKPGFEAALSKRGPGIMKKQSAEISEHVETIGFGMFEMVRDDLEVKLRAEVHQVMLATKSYWQDPKEGCGVVIQKELKRISTRLGVNGAKKNDYEGTGIDEATERKLIELIGAAPLIAFDENDDNDDAGNEFAKEDEIALKTEPGETEE
ncbi:hypothetical protein CABS01_01068 [Colletotrichum abscissum]|uniref:Tat pathway signal sequence n=1 Tax=Colletotrichum abscissum TaxID=1671311 RepID=A0A9Q0B462_9PEZI|nr:uncharacterized protein CABS01_01068 [Colletotrichum abscissum]KAI3554375.1 hypothetical protein CABS02_05506 [Colletotrichum abscissum]KAK1505600.1 hypothetical protein CABS01_01068 [Colletotrichum abscissum]